jgi:cell shape-determining protein MreD
MMRWVQMFIFLFLGALIQLQVPPWPQLGGMKPPILMALVIYYAMHASAGEVKAAVCWAALLYEGLEFGGIGPGILTFALLAWGVYRVRFEIFVDGMGTQGLFGLIGGIVLVLVAMILYGLTRQRPVQMGLLFRQFLGAGVLGMITLPLVCFFVKHLEALFPEKRRGAW